HNSTFLFLFFDCRLYHPDLHSFPTRRSSDLYRYGMMLEDQPTPEDNILHANGLKVYVDGKSIPLIQGSEIDYVDTLMGAGFTVKDRKSTRLNSSHLVISYAVFCLKKKKKKIE